MRIIFVTLFALLNIAAVAEEPRLSPAQQRIESVTRQINANPTKANLYTELAISLIRRERETCDKSLLDQAQTALDKASTLAPANLESQKTEVALLLARHDFSAVLARAQSLNKKVPDDVLIYGYVADADIALGDYSDAEKAAQWMLDLRTHNVPGLLRAAELRQIFGDSEGALQFLNDCYQQTTPDQSEDAAWILSRMAEINLSTGKLDAADQLSRKALASFPDYYRALEVQAHVREDQHKYSEAAELLHSRNQHFPRAGSIYAEAVAQEHAGNASQAAQLYANFEQLAQSQSAKADNDNCDLVLYYIARKQNARALQTARLALSQRHDVWTLDSLAQALYASGDYADAQKQIEKAVTPGIRDGDIFYHAAEISAALKNQAATVQYLKSSLEANPESTVSDNARAMLARISPAEYGSRRKGY